MTKMLLLLSNHHLCPLLNLISVHLQDIMGSYIFAPLHPSVGNHPMHAVINWRIPKNIVKITNWCVTYVM